MQTGKLRKSLGSRVGKAGLLAVVLGAIQPIRWLLEVVSDAEILKSWYPFLISIPRHIWPVLFHPLFSLLSLIIGVILILIKMGGKEEIPVRSIASGFQPEDRVFLSETTTSKALRDLRNGKTTLEAERATQPYIGKWMRVSGKVHDIIPLDGRGHYIIIGDAEIGMAGVWLRFEKEWDSRISILNSGQAITATGQLAQVHARDVILEHCELLSY